MQEGKGREQESQAWHQNKSNDLRYLNILILSAQQQDGRQKIAQIFDRQHSVGIKEVSKKARRVHGLSGSHIPFGSQGKLRIMKKSLRSTRIHYVLKGTGSALVGKYPRSNYSGSQNV